LGGGRPEDGHADAGRREPADDAAESCAAAHRDQVWKARQGDAGVRSTGVQRRPLLLREMERILDFLQVKVVGQGPMNRAKCVEYWGSDVDVCKEFLQ
jgi:hypothetical protein